MFPEYSHLPFYAGGQSFAGKYIPNLGCYIHQRNTDPHTPRQHLINFKGIYVGAGYCDPEHMMPVFADYLYHSGMVSNSSRQAMKKQFTAIITEWMDGSKERETLYYMLKFLSDPVKKMGIDTVNNLLGEEATNDHLAPGLNQFMNSAAARVKLHVGYASLAPNGYLLTSGAVANSLKTDFLTSTTAQNAFLMDRYKEGLMICMYPPFDMEAQDPKQGKVLHYSGNLDIVVNVPMTEAFLQHVPWQGQQQYRHADRHTWYVDGQLAGWVTVVRNFSRVIIRNSGHMAPYDQPERTLAMMTSFVFDQPFESRP
ncbi:hypothetical protein ACOMHN_043367 [Nucella lapillus]